MHIAASFLMVDLRVVTDFLKTVLQYLLESSWTSFFCVVFACFLKLSPDFRVFHRFTIDLYIKIVVIVNADFSVDKSIFFNRINRLREKKSLHKPCIGKGAKLYKMAAFA